MHAFPSTGAAGLRAPRGAGAATARERAHVRWTKRAQPGGPASGAAVSAPRAWPRVRTLFRGTKRPWRCPDQTEFFPAEHTWASLHPAPRGRGATQSAVSGLSGLSPPQHTHCSTSAENRDLRWPRKAADYLGLHICFVSCRPNKRPALRSLRMINRTGVNARTHTHTTLSRALVRSGQRTPDVISHCSAAVTSFPPITKGQKVPGPTSFTDYLQNSYF